MGAESERADVHAQRRHHGRRTEARPARLGRRSDARAHDRAPRPGLQEVHQRHAAGEGAQLLANLDLRGGRRGDHLVFAENFGDSTNRRLFAGICRLICRRGACGLTVSHSPQSSSVKIFYPK